MRIVENKNDNEARIELIGLQRSMDFVKATDLENQNRKQISVLAKEDESILIKALGELINQLRDSLNIANTMTPMQSYETSCLLIEKFWYFTLEDFILAFKKIKLGEYSKLYNRLDIATLSADLIQYDSERVQFIEKKREREAAEHRKQNLETQIDYEQVKKDNEARMIMEREQKAIERSKSSVMSQYYANKANLKTGYIYHLLGINAPFVFDGTGFECLLSKERAISSSKVSEYTNIHISDWAKPIIEPQRFNDLIHREELQDE